MKNWQELNENNLPTPHTLCFIKRNHKGNQSVYIGYRDGRPFTKDKDPSEDCYWTGRNVNDIDSENNNTKFSSLFSDVTVSHWVYISDAVEILNKI